MRAGIVLSRYARWRLWRHVQRQVMLDADAVWCDASEQVLAAPVPTHSQLSDYTLDGVRETRANGRTLQQRMTTYQRDEPLSWASSTNRDLSRGIITMSKRRICDMAAGQVRPSVTITWMGVRFVQNDLLLRGRSLETKCFPTWQHWWSGDVFTVLTSPHVSSAEEFLFKIVVFRLCTTIG